MHTWQQPRNIVHLSHHRHDRFHCGFSFSRIGNIYVAPGSFYSYPSHCGGTHSDREPGGSPLPALPCLSPVLIFSVGRILRKPPDPAEGKGMHRISSRSQIHRKGNFFHSLFLSPPWLLPSKMISLDGKFSYPASASGILIQECQHLYLFKGGGAR